MKNIISAHCCSLLHLLHFYYTYNTLPHTFCTWNTLLYITTQYLTSLHKTAHYYTILHITTHCCTILHIAAQYRTMPHIAVLTVAHYRTFLQTTTLINTISHFTANCLYILTHFSKFLRLGVNMISEILCDPLQTNIRHWLNLRGEMKFLYFLLRSVIAHRRWLQMLSSRCEIEMRVDFFLYYLTQIVCMVITDNKQ